MACVERSRAAFGSLFPPSSETTMKRSFASALFLLALASCAAPEAPEEADTSASALALFPSGAVAFGVSGSLAGQVRTDRWGNVHSTKADITCNVVGQNPGRIDTTCSLSVERWSLDPNVGWRWRGPFRITRTVEVDPHTGNFFIRYQSGTDLLFDMGGQFRRGRDRYVLSTDITLSTMGRTYSGDTYGLTHSFVGTIPVDAPLCLDGAACDDGDPCTVDDVCSEHQGCHGKRKTCDSPPPSLCLDSTTLRTFASTAGGCTAGTCRYTSTDVTCPGGCADGACATGGTDRWTVVTSLPTPRSYLGVARGPDGRIYAAGGSTTSGTVATVEAFDPATRTWSTVAPMLTARSSFGLVRGGDNRLYAIGGANESSGLSSVEAYSTVTDRWEYVSSLATPRTSLAVTGGSDGKLYALGGFDATGYTRKIDVYNPTNNTWSPFQDMPFERSAFAAATDANGVIYAIGSSRPGGPSADVSAFTASTSTAVARMLKPRDRHTAATARSGILYAIGGMNVNPLADVEAYDPSANRWHAVASLVTPRYGAGAATGLDGRIYVMGGLGRSGRLKSVEAYTP